ncbi:MAG: glycoside hydrolase domain-containing protein, partial [Verrucomicrobiota bacterium]
LFTPLVADVTKDGRAIVLEQVSQGKYRLTRTIIIRRDFSGVEARFRLENLEAEPGGFALRLHNMLSPGARGEYQSPNDLVFLPGEKGLLEWQQNLPLDKFKEANAGCAVRGDVSAAGTAWKNRAKNAPQLSSNWAALVNPENGDGMLMFVDDKDLMGFYNHPKVTVEPFFKAQALQRGESWETRIFLCAFGGAKGKSLQGATPLFAVLNPLSIKDGRLKGEISPMFSGRLRIATGKDPAKALAEYPAEPLKPIQIDAGASPDWLLIALDSKGEEIGRVAADGSVKLFEPKISREKKERPKVTGKVFQIPAEEAGIRATVKARDFVIQCDWNESEPVRDLAAKMAEHLGVGIAWTPRFSGKMIALGSAGRSATVRNAGLLKQSVDATWPGAGRGAILEYANFESTAKPLVLVAGSDDAGALAAAEAFYDKYVKGQPAAKGFDFWASPVSEPGMVWSRPTTATVLKQIEIGSARNEYESAQIILTPYEALKDVEVTVDPLIHAVSGKPISEKFSNPFRKRCGPLRVRWAENYPLKAEEGWPGTPDALLSRPVTNLPAGRSQCLWLTTLVANDAEPGLYRSAIHVKAGGETRSIPIQLNVYDFTLPVTGLKGEAYMSMSQMSPRRRLNATDVGLLITSLVEHRFRIIYLEEPGMIQWHVSPEGKFKGIQTDFLLSNDDGTLLMDTTRFDWLQETCDQYANPVKLDFNISLLNLIDWPSGISAFAKACPDRFAGRPERGGHAMQGYWSQEMQEMFRRHLEQRGLFDRVSVKVGDEPPGFDWWWNNVAQATIGAGLHFFTAFNSIDAKQAEKALGTKLNRFQPLYQQFDPEFAKRAQASGREIGWYNCGPPPRSGVGTSVSELRSYYWQAAKYNLDFVARWGVQCWGSEGTTPENVWTNRYSHHNSLIYPTHPDKPPYLEKGKGWVDSAPLDSIRYELIRDGIEDADYVRVLRGLIAQAKSDGKTDAADRGEAVLQSIWDKTYPTLSQYNPPYAELLDARSKVADAIIALQAELPPPATQKPAGGVKAK